MASASATRSGFIVKMKRAIVATCAIILFLAAPAGYAAAQGDAAVRVTGRGETAYEARQDAVRQALQQTVEQLVISQQVVKNDKLVMDRVISTMNGFVSQFTPVQTWTEKGSVLIEADIVVSETRITNFVSLTKTGRTAVNSDNILAAAQAEKLAQKTRGEMLAALFQGFPGRAPLEASPLSIAMNKVDSDFLDVETTVRFAPGFISSLRAGLKALGAKPPAHFCKGGRQFDGGQFHDCQEPGLHPPNSIMVCFSERITSDHQHGWRNGLAAEKDCHILPDVDLGVLGYPPDFYSHSRVVPPSFNGDSGEYYCFPETNSICLYSPLRLKGAPRIMLANDGRPLAILNSAAISEQNYGFVTDDLFFSGAFGYSARQLTIQINVHKIMVKGRVAVADLDGVDEISVVPMLYGQGVYGEWHAPLADDFPIRIITDPDDYKSFINELISGN